MNNENFLTNARNLVEKDWPLKSQFGLRDIIKRNEEAMLDRTNKDKDPLYDSKNLPIFRGYFRWFLLPGFLERAIGSNYFPGITSHWIPLGNGSISAFEMRGKYTRVIPCHLIASGMSPRKSTYRCDLQRFNKVNPFLKGFEPENDSAVGNNLISLLMVYGGKDGEFAYLRAYTNPKDRSIYDELSDNIMRMPDVPSIDSESVSEPLVTLKTPDDSKDPTPATARTPVKSGNFGSVEGSSRPNKQEQPSDRIKNEQSVS